MGRVSTAAVILQQRNEINRLIGEVNKGNAWLNDLRSRNEEQRRKLEQPELLMLSRLHPKIRERCEGQFQQGYYDEAIMNAFKALEHELRSKIGGDPERHGTDLVGDAMGGDDPLLKFGDCKGEHQGLQLLFRGSVGWFRNRHAHKFVDVKNSVEALEILSLASHLMRILDTAKEPEIAEDMPEAT